MSRCQFPFVAASRGDLIHQGLRSLPLVLTAILSPTTPSYASDAVISSVCRSSAASINELAQDPLLRRFIEQTCGLKLEAPISEQAPPTNAEHVGLPAQNEPRISQREIAASPPQVPRLDHSPAPVIDPNPIDTSSAQRERNLLMPPPIIPNTEQSALKTHHHLHGLFLEVSAYRYGERDSRPRHSSLPSIGLVARDERSIFASSEFRGLSGNIEVALGETEFVETGDERNQIQRLQTEVYLPLPKVGFFAGLGYRRFVDDAGPGFDRAGRPEIDRRSEYLYIPLGWTSQNKQGWRTKLQFNYLLRSHQTDHYSQIIGSTDLKTSQRRGYGLDLRLGNELGWEFFARYWRLRASKHSTYVLNGLETESQTPQSNTLEFGLRRQLR